MKTLHVQQSEVEYVAVLAAPAFPLWASVAGMMGGLYDAFAGYHTGLADLTVEGGPGDPLGRNVVVSLGTQGSFRVGYDRIQAAVPEYTDQTAERLPDVLARGAAWLRSSWPAASVDAHYLTFSIHASLDQGTSVEYLRALPGPRLRFGENLGTGLIFHSVLPGSAWQIHLTLDHSEELQGALFVRYVVTIGSDLLDYPDVLARSDALLVNALASVGLAFAGVE